ncbi:hypothetical protein ACPW96_21555 [Micromonospora sp. DT81.3]|uniref:hypothetical protein n=1 Tax=Micromonospora sp. DT81.3 TaxID=3416523 RepID=UPI003CF50C70
MTHDLHDWDKLAPEDRVIVRDRRTASEQIVTVRQTLPAIEGEGPGFVDTNGQTYRHHFHAARRVDPTRSCGPDQPTVDRLFAALTQPMRTS